MQFDRSILDYLRTGSWVGSSAKYPSCPVDCEKGKYYVRYDGLRIGNANDSNGGVLIQFTFHGAAVAWVHAYGCKLNTLKHTHADEPITGRLLIEKT